MRPGNRRQVHRVGNMRCRGSSVAAPTDELHRIGHYGYPNCLDRKPGCPKFQDTHKGCPYTGPQEMGGGVGVFDPHARFGRRGRSRPPLSYCCSRALRTLLAASWAENGFCRKLMPSSRMPCLAMALAV